MKEKKKGLIRKFIEVCTAIVAVVAVCTAIIKPEAFVNSIGWVPVSTIPADNYFAVRAQSVAKGIQIVGRFQHRCTWWVADQKNKIAITNGHCYNEKKVKLGDQKTPYILTFPNGDKVSCSNVLAHSPWEELDYMIVECDDELPPALEIDMKTILRANDKLVHISWNCDYVEEAGTGDSKCAVVPMIDYTEDCKVIDSSFRNGLDFTQGCDSLAGSSGSPVHLQNNGFVIGLHHSGSFFPNSEKFGSFNGSVHIRKVVQDIREKGIRIDFVTNEENAKVPQQNPVDNPVDVDGKKPTEGMDIIELIELIIQAIIRLFSK